MYFQRTPRHHQIYDAYFNDEFPTHLMDHFLFLNWNVIVPKHFLALHAELLFTLHFYLPCHWYCCAHQIALYLFNIPHQFCCCVPWIVLYIKFSLYHWSCQMNPFLLPTLWPMLEFTSNSSSSTSWLIWFFMLLFYFQLSLCFRDSS